MVGVVTNNGAGAWTSPLREIERAAQDRAKSANLDMSTPGAVDHLRTLLLEEVARWREEFRRGHRPVDIADPDAAVDRALRNLAGYGPLEPLLEDPDVWEIMIAGYRTGVFRVSAGQRHIRLTARDRK